MRTDAGSHRIGGDMSEPSATAKAPTADRLTAYLDVLKREETTYGERPKVEVKATSATPQAPRQ